MIGIIIPSYKPINHVMQDKMLLHSLTNGSLIWTAREGSASTNRNYGLDRVGACCDHIIMVDDDIQGFYDGWDRDLIKPLQDNQNIIMTSARLMTRQNTPAYTMVENYDLDTSLIFSPKVPTAACAFRNTDLRFDENFIGSGFEDDDFCKQLYRRYGTDKLMCTVNACKLVHLNEMKNQGGKYWEANRKYFVSKWGVQDCEYLEDKRCKYVENECCKENCKHGRFG